MNKIEIISKEQFKEIVDKNINNYHIAIIDGKKNKDWNSYRETIEELFKFPTKNNNYDGYCDWMQDLSWFDVDGFIVCIINYNDFLSNDLKSKNIIMKMFCDTLLSWWDEEVEKYVVGGEKKFSMFF